MAIRTHPTPVMRGSRRRAKIIFTTAVTIFAVTAFLVVANLVSDRYHARIDVTAAGTQRLAPRTEKLLAQLEEPLKIVIAADLKAADSRARERLKNVLTEMKRSSRKIDFAIIDTVSASGLTEYKRLLRELVERDQQLIIEQKAALNLAATGAQALAAYLNNELSPGLRQVQESIPGIDKTADANRAYFEHAAASARLLSQDLGSAVTRSHELLAQHLDDIPMPATDAAAQTLAEGLGRSVNQLTEQARQLRRFSEDPANAGGTAHTARSLIEVIERQRDQAAVLHESLRRLARLDLLRIADVLRSGNAAIIVGPPSLGLAAMDLGTILPTTAWLDATNAGKADLNRRIEEVITTSVGSMLNPVRPIVVLVHPERPFFDQPQLVERNFGPVFQRLAFHGIDVIEWAVSTDAAPPRLPILDPDGKRPVVYVALPADSTEGSDAAGNNGVKRAARIGEVLLQLAKGGRNLLISCNPSILQTYGQPDPVAPALDHFNLVPASARPLFRDRITPSGRLVITELVAFPDETTGALPGALQGLPMMLPWPVAFHAKPGEASTNQTLWRLYTIAADESTWAESQWLPMWQTPTQQRHLMPNPPVFDDGRDLRAPQNVMGQREPGWLVAAAVELRPSRGPAQRLVAVGSREWFSSKAVSPIVEVDGRTGAVYPGNMELFEASVFWLAGQDDLIAQSPTAQTVSLVQPIDVKVLSGLRLTMIVGLPLFVLAFGLVYRLIRG